MHLKKAEKLKINYARKHFESLGHNSIKYDMVKSYQSLMQKVMK